MQELRNGNKPGRAGRLPKKEIFYMKRLAWLTLVLTLSGGLVFRQPSKLKFSSELQNVDPRASVDVIVQFDQVPTDVHHQKVPSRGGQLKQTLPVLPGSIWSSAGLADYPEADSPRRLPQHQGIGAKYPQLLGNLQSRSEALHMDQTADQILESLKRY